MVFPGGDTKQQLCCGRPLKSGLKILDNLRVTTRYSETFRAGFKIRRKFLIGLLFLNLGTTVYAQKIYIARHGQDEDNLAGL